MKKLKVLLICLLALSVCLTFGVYVKNKNSIAETFSVNAVTEEKMTEELITALFMQEITNEVMRFYSEYYSGEIAVYNYEVTIIDINKEQPGFISIQFGVTPQVGAHNPLGYDELTYQVDSSGNKELVKYQHLKNYEIPKKFQEYIIK